MKITMSTTILSLISLISFSQGGVAINNTGVIPNPNAILDVSSDGKGVLFSRLTTVARNTLGTALGNTDNGMFVYDKDLLVFFYWDGTQWVQVGAGTGSDNQNLTGATLTGTSLQIDIEDGNSTTVDLSSLQDGVNDADSDITNEIQDLSLNSTTNILTITNNGSATSIDLTPYLDNTDAQDLTLTGDILSLTNDNTTVDLSSLKDHDWYEVGGTTQPDAITDDIFTQGNVGVGTTNPSAKLEISSGVNSTKIIGDQIIFTRNNANYIRAETPGGYLIFNTNGNPSNLASSTMALLANQDAIFPNGNMGIGTNTPTEKLEVQGSVKIVDGTEGAGKVLTSDANGKASWESGVSLPFQELILGETAAISNNSGIIYTGFSITFPSEGVYQVTLNSRITCTANINHAIVQLLPANNTALWGVTTPRFKGSSEAYSVPGSTGPDARVYFSQTIQVDASTGLTAYLFSSVSADAAGTYSIKIDNTATVCPQCSGGSWIKLK